MSEQSFAALDQARQSFLSKIPQSYQGHTCNLFLAPVRERGLWRADLVLDAVKADVKQRGHQAKAHDNQQTYQNLMTLWGHLTGDPDGALILAEWAVAYELLPKERKQERKDQRDEAGKQAAMRGKPPTEKQVDYLRKHGYTGEIPDRWQASVLIDGYIQKGATHGAHRG